MPLLFLTQLHWSCPHPWRHILRRLSEPLLAESSPDSGWAPDGECRPAPKNWAQGQGAWGSQVSLHDESKSWYPVFAKWLANGCSSLQLSKEVGKQSSELRINRIVRLYIWWRVVWDFTSQNSTSQNTSHWRVVWDFTSHNNTSWRVVSEFTSHNSHNNTSWRVVWDLTSHNNTSWRVVWDLTSDNNTKGGVRPYIRGKWWHGHETLCFSV